MISGPAHHKNKYPFPRRSFAMGESVSIPTVDDRTKLEDAIDKLRYEQNKQPRGLGVLFEQHKEDKKREEKQGQNIINRLSEARKELKGYSLAEELYKNATSKRTKPDVDSSYYEELFKKLKGIPEKTKGDLKKTWDEPQKVRNLPMAEERGLVGQSYAEWLLAYGLASGLYAPMGARAINSVIKHISPHVNSTINGGIRAGKNVVNMGKMAAHNGARVGVHTVGKSLSYLGEKASAQDLKELLQRHGERLKSKTPTPNKPIFAPHIQKEYLKPVTVDKHPFTPRKLATSALSFVGAEKHLQKHPDEGLKAVTVALAQDYVLDKLARYPKAIVTGLLALGWAPYAVLSYLISTKEAN